MRKKLSVSFIDIPEFKESEEEAIITRNRKLYKKERDVANPSCYRIKKNLFKI